MKTKTTLGILMLVVAALISPITKGENNNMATLLFDEQFEGCSGNDNTCLRSRGWNTSTSPGNPYFYEHDATLNKTVTYNRWTNGDRGMPDNGDNDGTIGKNIPVAQWNNGITIHTVLKFHNFIMNGNGGNCHTPIRAAVTGYEGNAPGEVIFEVHRRGHGVVSYPSNAHDSDRSFWMSFDWQGSSPTGSDFNVDNINNGSYVNDDVWYEVVIFVNTNNGGSNGRVALWYRPYGDSEWIELFDYSGIRILDVATTNPFVGMGPYLHSNSSSDEVRAYVGWLTVWSGDAMADGQIPGAATPPPDTEGPEITGFNVSPQTNTAAVGWLTNEPATSQVDYGTSPTYGHSEADVTLKTRHVLQLSGLTPNTEYHYCVSSKDAEGNETVSNDSTFTTRSDSSGVLSLNDLSDVSLSATIADGEGLIRNGEVFVNAPIESSGGGGVVVNTSNVAIAVDERNFPHIAFYNAETGKVTYTVKEPSGWTDPEEVTI